MRTVYILTALFIFLSAANSFAQPPIKAQVDKTSLTVGQSLTYKMTINITGEQQPQVRIPKFEGFNVISSVKSSKMAFVKNNVVRIIVHIFVLVPARPGNFKIGSSIMKIKGNTYSTDTFEIEVKEDKIKPQTPQEKEPALLEKPRPKKETPKITL